MASNKRNEKVHPLYVFNKSNIEEKLPTVDIVIPAFNNQEILDLTLTALEKLNYPSKMLKLFVLDDGSEVKLKVNAKLKFKVSVLRKEPNEEVWGKASITKLFTLKFKSEYIWFLDSDMVVERDHLLNLVKSAVANKNSIALGYKRFVKDYERDVSLFKSMLESKEFDEIYPEAYGHDYWENLVEDSNQLQDLNHDIFKSLVGASFLIRNEDYKTIGGYEDVASAEDTILGYQAYNKGMSFLPVREARSYHLGSSTMQKHQEVMLNHNMAILADKIPTLYHYRSAPYATYEREHTFVIYNYKGENFEKFTRNLRAINTLSTSFKILLPINSKVLKRKYRALDDKYKDLRKIYNYYKSSPNLEFIDTSNFELSLNSILIRLSESYAAVGVYVDGDLEPMVDFKNMYKFFRPSNKVAIGGLDTKDSKIIVTTPALLNRFSNLNKIGDKADFRIYFKAVDSAFFEWLTYDRFVSKVNERKDYWKFIKYLFRRLKTIRNFNDVKSFAIKGRIIISNYLANR